MRGCAKCGSALGVGAPGPFVTILRILEPPQQLIRPEPFPGQHFPHHPVDLRPRDLGHLSPPKPVAGSAEKLRPAGTWLCGDASPPRCGSRTRPAPPRFSQSRRACPMKLGREVSRHNELDNWRNTHRFESVMATKWLLLTISETEPGLWDRLRTPFLYATGSLLRMPGSPMGYPPERWTGSSGVRCHPDSGGKWPSGFRRASACWLDEPSER